jgi:hypothetical protein
MKQLKTSPHQLLSAFLVLTALSAVAHAGTDAPSTQKKLLASSSPSSRTGAAGHGKNLNFDGDYVETMGKNPLDSLTALSESQKNRNSHLYRKRSEFAPETAETLKQSRFEQ